MLQVPRDSTGGDTGFGSTAGDPRQRRQEKSVCHTGLLLPCRDEEEPRSTWWWGSSHLPKTWSVLGSNSLGWHLKTCSSHACVLSHHSNPYRRGDICDGTAGLWTLTWPLWRCILNIPPVTPYLPPLGALVASGAPLQPICHDTGYLGPEWAMCHRIAECFGCEGIFKTPLVPPLP